MVRVDTAIREEIKALSRAQAHDACELGLVRARDGRALAKGDKVASRDELDLSALRVRLAILRRPAADFEITRIHEAADRFLGHAR